GEIYLVGHSLGVPAILRYLEKDGAYKIAGTILVSGPNKKNGNRKIDSFLETGFDYKAIKEKAGKVAVIHGDNDPYVPFSDAEELSRELGGELIAIPSGGHLNGSAGYTELPECLMALEKMFGSPSF